MPNAIDGAFTKLEWTQKHLALLQGEITRFSKRSDYTLVDEIDPESGRHIQRARDLPEPPSDIGMMFWDVVHNLRAALDYSVYRPTRRGEAQTSFPIYLVGTTGIRKKRCYTKDGVKGIQHLSAPAQEFIDFVQPYHRNRHGRESALWILQTLAIAEKHHRVPFMVRRGERTGSEIYPRGGKDIPESVDGGPAEFDEGGIAAVLWSPRHPDIDLKPHLALQILLTEQGPAYGAELGSVAGWMYNQVAWVLGGLQRTL